MFSPELRGIGGGAGEMLTTSAHQYEHMAIMLTAYLCDLVSFDGTMADHDQYRWMRPRIYYHSLAPADIPVAARCKILIIVRQ